MNAAGFLPSWRGGRAGLAASLAAGLLLAACSIPRSGPAVSAPDEAARLRWLDRVSWASTPPMHGKSHAQACRRGWGSSCIPARRCFRLRCRPRSMR